MKRTTINKVEICGAVGAKAKITNIQNTSYAKVPVATNEIYRNSDGTVVAETTWHCVVVFEKNSKVKFEDITPGKQVHLLGRIKNTKYKCADGSEKYFTEIIASNFELCEEEKS